MLDERAQKKSILSEFTSKDTWVPPAFGLVASILVSLIGVATALEYRSEAAFAAFLLVTTLTSSYRSQLFKEKPLVAIGIALVSAALGIGLFVLIP